MPYRNQATGRTSPVSIAGAAASTHLGSAARDPGAHAARSQAPSESGMTRHGSNSHHAPAKGRPPQVLEMP